MARSIADPPVLEPNLDQISWVPRRPQATYGNEANFDFDTARYGERSPSPASFISHADSMAPIGSAGAFKCDLMVKFLRQRQLEKVWSNTEDGEGVVLKRGKGDFVCQPSNLLVERNGLFAQVGQLNVKVFAANLALGQSADKSRLQ
jgi:hypothetical protein